MRLSALGSGLRRAVDFRGRATRREYLAVLAVGLPLLWLVQTLVPDRGWLLAVRVVLVVLIAAPLAAVEVRRLHDTGRPASDLLWGLIPVVGPLMLGWWTLGRSEANANVHGPSRPPAPGETRATRLRVRRRTRLDAAGNVIGHEYVDDWGNVIPDDQVQ